MTRLLVSRYGWSQVEFIHAESIMKSDIERVVDGFYIAIDGRPPSEPLWYFYPVVVAACGLFVYWLFR